MGCSNISILIIPVVHLDPELSNAIKIMSQCLGDVKIWMGTNSYIQFWQDRVAVDCKLSWYKDFLSLIWDGVAVCQMELYGLKENK